MYQLQMWYCDDLLTCGHHHQSPDAARKCRKLPMQASVVDDDGYEWHRVGGKWIRQVIRQLHYLPPLTGSEKQIAWATRLREQAWKYTSPSYNAHAVSYDTAEAEWIFSHVEASWWINHRDYESRQQSYSSYSREYQRQLTAQAR